MYFLKMFCGIRRFKHRESTYREEIQEEKMKYSLVFIFSTKIAKCCLPKKGFAHIT